MQFLKSIFLSLLARQASAGNPACEDPNSLACNCRKEQNVVTDPYCKAAFLNAVTEGDPSRIIGGEPAPPGLYPWFVRFIYSSNEDWAGCGGMLVAPEIVLTAAHCVFPNTDLSASVLSVQVGAVCPEEADNCGVPMETINVKKALANPQYNDKTSDDDFAILQLATRSSLTPVEMDSGLVDSYSSSKNNLWAIGFGVVEQKGFLCLIFGICPVASELMHAELSFVPRDECNANYDGEISDKMMCAADPGQDACQGDSGGPLYDSDNDVVVGITSWGYGCADPDYPGVYSQISTRYDDIWFYICKIHSNPKPAQCSM